LLCRETLVLAASGPERARPTPVAGPCAGFFVRWRSINDGSSDGHVRPPSALGAPFPPIKTRCTWLTTYAAVGADRPTTLLRSPSCGVPAAASGRPPPTCPSVAAGNVHESCLDDLTAGRPLALRIIATRRRSGASSQRARVQVIRSRAIPLLPRWLSIITTTFSRKARSANKAPRSQSGVPSARRAAGRLRSGVAPYSASSSRSHGGPGSGPFLLQTSRRRASFSRLYSPRIVRPRSLDIPGAWPRLYRVRGPAPPRFTIASLKHLHLRGIQGAASRLVGKRPRNDRAC